MGRHRILVVSTDPLTPRMPGPAIRAWHLAEVLAGEHDVVLASTVASDRSHNAMTVQTLTEVDARADLERWMDVAVIPGGLFHEWPDLAASRKPLVVDIYDPYHLENLEPMSDRPIEERDVTFARFTTAINQHLARGDFFLCATERQQDFWLGSLTALGRVNPYTYAEDAGLHSLVSVVPFGISAEPPRRTEPGLRATIDGIAPTDKVILWAGGVYNWFDPCSLVQAVDRLRVRVPNVRLVFLGMGHPNPAMPPMPKALELRQLADRLGLVGHHVFFNEEWVPYDERANSLLDADVGVSMHLDHIEARYSFRTRVLDYLWAGLPMVLTKGDVLADLVEREGLGRTVAAGDVAAIEEALFDMIISGPAGRDFGAVAQRFHWDQVARPLADFCRSPRRAPDLVARPVVPAASATAGRRLALPIRAASAMRSTARSLLAKVRRSSS